MNHQKSFWVSFTGFHSKRNVTWVRFSELNSDVRPLGSELPLRSSEHKSNYQEFYSLKNTLYCIMSFSNRVKLAYIKFLGNRGKKFDIGWNLIYSRNITCACNRPGFPIWLLYTGFNIGRFNSRGFHWICVCVFQDIYGMCFLEIKIRLIPESRKAKYSWEQEFWDEFDQLQVV